MRPFHHICAYSTSTPLLLPVPFLRPLLLALLLLAGAATAASATQVDTLTIPNAAMRKTYRAAVVLPASYTKNKKAIPITKWVARR